MILGIGTDIIEHKRIEKIYKNYGKKFLERYFNEDEIEYSLSKPNPIPYLAARFAVKEAVIKTLNIRHRIGLLYKNIEVSGRTFGKKQLKLKGKIAEIAKEKGVKNYHLTISHSENFSIAIVILEG
jgi:holo-[acyl-carrier protein] synthase